MLSVYVIVDGKGRLKVGVSQDVERRLKGIQASNPLRLWVSASWERPTDAYAVESEAHRLLGRYRMAGEWFRVGRGIAVKAVERAIRNVEAGKARPNRRDWQRRDPADAVPTPPPRPIMHLPSLIAEVGAEALAADILRHAPRCSPATRPRVARAWR